MDPGGIGALIGIGIMVCVICTSILYEKTENIKVRFKRFTASWNHEQKPLLPVSKTNPVLVKSLSKQFQMKDILST